MGAGHFVLIVYTLTGHVTIFKYLLIKPHTSTRAIGFAAPLRVVPLMILRIAWSGWSIYTMCVSSSRRMALGVSYPRF